MGLGAVVPSTMELLFDLFSIFLYIVFLDISVISDILHQLKLHTLPTLSRGYVDFMCLLVFRIRKFRKTRKM